MSTFRKLIDNRIKELSNCFQNLEVSEGETYLLADCSQEQKALYLLEDEKFVEIIEKYFGENDTVELSDFLCECAQNGYPIADSKQVLNYLLYDEVDIDRAYILPRIDSTKQDIGSTVINIILDEGDDNKVEVNCQEEYYFKLNYFTVEKVGGVPQQYILIDSNMIDTTQLVVDLLGAVRNCQFENCQGKIKVYLIGVNSFHELNIHSFDYKKIALSTEKNEVTIIGDATSVEDCFLMLKGITKSIYNIVDGANILNKLKDNIHHLDYKFKQVKLNRLQLSSQTLADTSNYKILKIEDILNVGVQELSKDALLELTSTIENLDLSMPDELVVKLMRKLRPAQESIIKKRYFGDKVLTLEEIGKLHNITRERVRQLEKKSINIFNSPKNQLLRGRIISQMQLLSTYDNFITIEDLQKFGINKSIAILLAKCLDDIVYEQEWNLFFFNIGLLRKFESVLIEIPTEFTVNDLNFYAEYISDVLNNTLSVVEICYLLEKKYHKYGDFYVTGRLKQKTVLSYLMVQYFPDGIDLYDEVSLNLLREKAREHFDGFELSDNNRAITGRLQAFCSMIGRGIWKLDINRPVLYGELLERIIDYIKNYNSPVVPVSAVFAEFQDELSDLDIANKYHLQGQLKRVLPTECKTNRDYIYSGNIESFYKIIEEYIKQSNTIVTRKDILKQFPGISDIVIQQVATSTKVVNMFGYFVHLDNLQITDKEYVQFYQTVAFVINDNSIYHAKTIFQAIKGKMSGLFSRIGINHYLQFFYLFRELFPNDYNYVRPFMAKPGVEIVSGEAQVLQRLQSMQEIRLGDLREIAKDIGTIIDRYIEFADRNNDVILIKDRDTFISTDYLELDETMFDDLDNVLLQYLNDENYKSLSLFFDYWKLPKLKIKWTDWLLYSIINLYSKKFKTAVSSNYIAEAIPIVVKNEFDVNDISASEIRDMEKIDVDYFADDDDLIDELDIEDFE